MNLKKSLFIALLSFGIAQPVFAETDSEKFNRAMQLHDKLNYSAAFPLFKQLAEQGYAPAQYMLGEMYSNGRSITKNHKQAAYWYTKAAEQGHSSAQFALGWMYQRGRGVTQSDKQAIYWYEKAAEQGNDVTHPMALALIYESGGKDVAPNYKKAIYWYEKAEEIGGYSVKTELGNLYFYEKNYQKAAYWYTKALENRDSGAKIDIDMNVKSAINELHEQQNYSVAFPFFKQLSEHGYTDVDVQFYLAWMYQEGKGVPKNHKQAIYWYEKAAKQGSVSAQNNLGVMYEYGDGISSNLTKAKYYYGLACDGGSNKGCENYAKLDKQGVK